MNNTVAFGYLAGTSIVVFHGVQITSLMTLLSEVELLKGAKQTTDENNMVTIVCVGVVVCRMTCGGEGMT